MGGFVFMRHLRAPVPLRAMLLALLAACGSSERTAGKLSAVDDAGDTVSLAAPARRIVSLIPATTELLFAIGAGPDLVGRTAWCDYPAAARDVPNLGDGIKPNLEAIVAQRPDLVVLYNSAQNAEAAAHLRSLNIPTLELSLDRLSDVPRIGRLLGHLAGREASADSMAAAYDTALQSATAPPSGQPPKVLILVWDQPPMTVGAGSFLTELVERAGGMNLFADISASSGQVSIEAVVARDPDLVFVASEGTPTFAKRPEWQPVRAIREHHFVRVTSSAFNRPSPRAPQAIRELAKLIRESAP
jgi:iron complex transport system substrate-binding protein